MVRWGQRGAHRRFGLGASLVVVVVVAVVATVLLGAFGALGLAGGRTSGPGVVPASSPPSPEVSPPWYPSPDAPRFPIVTRAVADLADGSADLYLPLAGSGREASHRRPIVLLLADRGTDPGEYEQFAHDVASYGLAVVVTDRPAAAAVREIRTWARGVASDRRAYAHGEVGGAVRFVVAHGATSLPDATTMRGVGASVRLTPTVPVVVPARSNEVLLVCGDSPTTAVACARSSSRARRIEVPHTDASRVTDEGRRGARRTTFVLSSRLRTIAALARPTALWFLAHNGDVRARDYVANHVAAQHET